MLHPMVSMVKNLRDRGFSKLENIKFINARISHGDLKDIGDVMRFITEVKPHVLLLEILPGGIELSHKCQDYIEGRTAEMPINHKFIDPLLRRLRDMGRHAPLVVCAEPGPDWEETESIKIGIEPYNDFWKPNKDVPAAIEGFHNLDDAVENVKWRLSNYMRAQSKRERIIAGNTQGLLPLLTDDDQYRHLRELPEITILAPYGASHGDLTRHFQDMGAETGAIAQRYIFHPQEAVERKLRLNQPVTSNDFEDMLVGYRVNEALRFMSRQRVIPGLSENEETGATWKILRAMRKSDADFAELFREAKKDNIGFRVLVKDYYDKLKE